MNVRKARQPVKAKIEEGRKDDNHKTRFGLVPPLALLEVAKVLTFGADKYGVDNWRTVRDATTRYRDALGRHMNMYDQGFIFDDESKLYHLAHAVCCLLFMLELEVAAVNGDADRSVEI